MCYRHVKIYMKSQFMQQYVTYTLEHDKTPESVYRFTKSMGISEAEFYEHFAGLEALESALFSEWFIDAFKQCEESAPWAEYSVREKVLAVFYTFFEALKQQRSFVLFLKKRDGKVFTQWPAYLNGLRTVFLDKMKPVLNQGIESKELEARKYLDEKYADGLWLNFLFVLKFWCDDQSAGFEKTDAAIEKSVHLAMDLMGKSALDAALDFGRFLFQQRA